MGALRIVWLVSALIVGGGARADELCVSCEGPDARYRCEALGFTRGDAHADLACITELAKLEGHRICAVDRRATEPCDGPLKVVRRDLVPDLGGIGAAPAPGPTVEEPPREKPPTVASELKKAGDAVGETTRSAGETIGDATRSVGSAAQNAWKCVTSLFSEC